MDYEVWPVPQKVIFNPERRPPKVGPDKTNEIARRLGADFFQVFGIGLNRGSGKQTSILVTDVIPGFLNAPMYIYIYIYIC